MLNYQRVLSWAMAVRKVSLLIRGNQKLLQRLSLGVVVLSKVGFWWLGAHSRRKIEDFFQEFLMTFMIIHGKSKINEHPFFSSIFLGA